MDPDDDPQLAVEVPASPVSLLADHVAAYNRQLGRYEAVQMYGLAQLAFAVLNIDDRLATLPLQHRPADPPETGGPPGPEAGSDPEVVAGPEAVACAPAFDPARMVGFVPAMPGVTAPEAMLPSPADVAAGLRQVRFSGSLMSWFCANDRAENAIRVVVSTMHDCSLQKAYTLVSRALVSFVGLPRLTALVLRGQVPFERLDYTARKSSDLTLAQLEEMDASVSAIPAHRPMREVRRHVDMELATIVPEDEAVEQIHEQRAVLFEALPDGSATLTLRGPLAPLTALYKRTLACARGVVRQQLDAFGLDRGDTAGNDAELQLVEDRTIPQTMFDMLTGMAPATQLRVEHGDGGTQLLEVSCPTSAEWLRRQATVNVTVPVMTLLGRAELPGSLEGQHPIPAVTARQFAAESSTLYRLLTDPLTGEVLDEPAQKYAVPRAVRTTVQAAWSWCTAPGCSRRASTSETDHIESFNHRDPSAGGLTQVGNMQPLCKTHHDLKTRGHLRVVKGDDGVLRWTMMFGLTGEARKPRNPVEQRQARIIGEALPEPMRTLLHDDATPGSHWATSPPAEAERAANAKTATAPAEPDAVYLDTATELAQHYLGLARADELSDAARREALREETQEEGPQEDGSSEEGTSGTPSDDAPPF
ncbi:HNH endonuclease signature motif containing protein [Brevibacterium luteolum]|uniref:HNH endonuclease n=1 Tax=Brevibacterium luteolum TaxID=199591 RepID=A0A6G8KWN5_9MICO|nr:HNH endonuclease signature motif containing protein [Brevibacterium luteolum]QIN29033.1 HNH endonuclease [Brevibacterium luteolum]